MFRCLLQRRFLKKCSGSVVVSAPARTRIEALLRSLGSGILEGSWAATERSPGGASERFWRSRRVLGSILSKWVSRDDMRVVVFGLYNTDNGRSESQTKQPEFSLTEQLRILSSTLGILGRAARNSKQQARNSRQCSSEF